MKLTFRLAATILAIVLCLVPFTGCGGGSQPAAESSAAAPAPAAAESKVDETANEPAAEVETAEISVMNLWSFTDEVPNMAEDFKAKYNPSYEIKTTIIATDSGAYTSALDAALAAGGADAPDVFTGEGAFMKKYANSDYSLPLKDLGIDVVNEAKAAGIAQYTMDAASDANGQVKGLAYQGCGGVFIYRRSIAQEYLGSDDPATVYESIKDWDAYIATARMLKEKSGGKVVMVSGQGDIWHPMENSRSGPWIQNGKLVLDDNIMKFFEICKTFKQEGLWNETTDWQEAWYADFRDEGPAKVFGWFGPAWLLRYVILSNCGGSAPGEGTYGDWAVCEPTVPFYWGGTWLMANKDTQAKAQAADFIRYVCLDLDGKQAEWVLTGDTVASSVIMAGANGSETETGKMCGGQNIFEVFIPATEKVDISMMGDYDETINNLFRDEVSSYQEGSKDLETAIADFKMQVANVIDVEVD